MRVRPRLLLRLGKGLRRLELKREWREAAGEQADDAWRSMLARLDAEERERRLDAAEAALNKKR